MRNCKIDKTVKKNRERISDCELNLAFVPQTVFRIGNFGVITECVRKHCTGSAHTDEPQKAKRVFDYGVSVVDCMDTFEKKV